MNRKFIRIPEKFKIILTDEDQGIINTTASIFGTIYEDNRLYFFPEYTNHGISHIEDVLLASSELITNESYHYLGSKDITLMILSVILHDLGMHISKESLIKLIENTNTEIISDFDKKTWKEEWVDFFHKAKRFNEVQLEQIFGHKDIKIVEYDFVNNEEYSKKLLGEFLRRMHPRLAHEIAIIGYPTKDENSNINLNEALEHPLKDLAGLIARSHGVELRNTFKYLENTYSIAWSSPYNIKIIYLMTVLRIGDYIQIQKDRANKLILRTRRLSSPLSAQEWEKHNSIDFINTETDDPERIYVQASPKTSTIFLELQKLFKGLQYELDISWAVLGEVYGRHNDYKKLGLKYRRIQSNIDERDKFQKTVNYVPEKVIFDADPEILKLLIGPLYGEDPKYGIRELLQNSIDATKERIHFEEEKGLVYEPLVQFEIINHTADNFDLILTDNGVGMNKDTLVNYFFRAGASFRKSDFWIKQYGPEGIAKIERVGRFGVGVLAAYLLGDEISVTTRHVYSEEGLNFKAKLTSRQIELIKVKCDIGTRIEIKLKKDVIDLINTSEELDWFKWYKIKQPKLIIQINDTIKNKFSFNKEFDFIPNVDEQNDKWRQFQTHNFGKVKWSFKNDNQKDRFFKEHSDTAELIINGFKIPNGYLISTTKYNWKLPIVSVFDRNGMMPLSLNRNYLQNDTLPFEKELFENIAIDIIAKILSLEIDESGSFNFISRKNSILTYNENINLQPNIIFINENYILDFPFILQKLNIDLIPIVWIRETSVKDKTSIFKNGYISVISDLGSIISFSRQMDNYYNRSNPYNNWFSIFGINDKATAWKRIFLKTKKFEYLNQKNRIRQGFKTNIKKDKSNTSWTSFIYKENHYYQEAIQPADKINISPSSIDINALSAIESEIDLIIETKFGYYDDDDFDEDESILNVELDANEGLSKEKLIEFDIERVSRFKIFEDMLIKYIGSDFLIPIDFEARKNKFSYAFEELQEQITFHRKAK